MLPLLLASIAFAQSTVVTLGDGPLVAPSIVVTARTADTVPGGWVTVLADCLEERAPRAWTVVDRATIGETAKSASKRLGEVSELGPEVVVLGLGARELVVSEPDIVALRGDLTRLVAELRKGSAPPGVLLVGLVVPVLASDEAEVERRTIAYNGLLAEIAEENAGVHHVDLQSDWPQGRARATLTAEGGGLTDQGHARIAAAVCDAIVASWPAKIE